MRRVVLWAAMTLGLIGAFSLTLFAGPTAVQAAPVAPVATSPDACARLATLQRAFRYGIEVKPIAIAMADHHCHTNPRAVKGVTVNDYDLWYSFRSNQPCEALETDNPRDGDANAAIAELQAECVAEQVELVRFYADQPPACIREVNLANAGRRAEPVFKSTGKACDAALEESGQHGGLAPELDGIVSFAAPIILLILLGVVLSRVFRTRP